MWKVFNASRKITKTHQNVIVFSKGNAVKTAKSLGDLKLFDIDKITNYSQLTIQTN